MKLHKLTPDGRADDFYTIAQLWLAFVMREMHQKTWDGEAWQLK